MTDAISVDDFIATAAPRTETVRVCARNDLVRRHQELVLELKRTLGVRPDALGAEHDLPDGAEELLEELASVEEEQERSTLEVELTSIGAQAWADLLRLHPPGKEHRGHAHNPDTFPPAAVAACSVTPKLTEEQAAQMFEKIESAEWAKLWVAAIRLNELETSYPKLQAAVDLLRAKRPSADSPEPTGSLAEPSSVDSGTP